MSGYLSSSSLSMYRMARKKEAAETKGKSKSKIETTSALRKATNKAAASLSKRSGSKSSSSSSSSRSGTTRTSTRTTGTTSTKSQDATKRSSAMRRRDSLEVATQRRKKNAASDHEPLAGVSTQGDGELDDLLSQYGYRRNSSHGLEEEVKEEEHTRPRTASAATSSSSRSRLSSRPVRSASTSGAMAPGSVPVRGILKASKHPSEVNVNGGKRRVKFNRNASLHYMPEHEMVAARKSRKGPWEPAPEHDELWDGDLQEFRSVPLSMQELYEDLHRKEQQSSNMMGNGFDSMSYTFPPSNYTYGYNDDDLDELDSYLNEMTVSSSMGDASSSSSSRTFRGAKDESACYVCTSSMNWSTRQVSNWVRDHIAGGDYFSLNFEQNYVDGAMFLQMEEKDLRNIGIKRRSDRQAILTAKDELLRGSLATQNCNCGVPGSCALDCGDIPPASYLSNTF